MASLEVLEMLCEFANCSARATRNLVSQGVVKGRYCTRHATTALMATNKAEKEAAAQKPQAVKP